MAEGVVPFSVMTVGDFSVITYTYVDSKTIQMYCLNDPKPTKFINPSEMRFASLPVYDENFFKDMHEVLSVEKVNAPHLVSAVLHGVEFKDGKRVRPQPAASEGHAQQEVAA